MSKKESEKVKKKRRDFLAPIIGNNNFSTHDDIYKEFDKQYKKYKFKLDFPKITKHTIKIDIPEIAIKVDGTYYLKKRINKEAYDRSMKFILKGMVSNVYVPNASLAIKCEPEVADWLGSYIVQSRQGNNQDKPNIGYITTGNNLIIYAESKAILDDIKESIKEGFREVLGKK